MSDLLNKLQNYDWRGPERESVAKQAALRIAELESACSAYLNAFDQATGTVYVEPIIREVMKDKTIA